MGSLYSSSNALGGAIGGGLGGDGGLGDSLGDVYAVGTWVYLFTIFGGTIVWARFGDCVGSCLGHRFSWPGSSFWSPSSFSPPSYLFAEWSFDCKLLFTGLVVFCFFRSFVPASRRGVFYLRSFFIGGSFFAGSSFLIGCHSFIGCYSSFITSFSGSFGRTGSFYSCQMYSVANATSPVFFRC